MPKRFSDVYSERLDLTDEAGEKFRIKDLLLAHPCVSVTMHKGVQPKYVWGEERYSSAPALSVTPIAPISDIATTPKATINVSLSATKPATSWASAVSSPAPAPVVPVTVAALNVDGDVSVRGRRRGSPILNFCTVICESSSFMLFLNARIGHVTSNRFVTRLNLFPTAGPSSVPSSNLSLEVSDSQISGGIPVGNFSSEGPVYSNEGIITFEGSPEFTGLNPSSSIEYKGDCTVWMSHSSYYEAK